MFLKRLLLRNFRNYAKVEAFFSPSVNWIQGDNGQGKTNLLEAVHFISTGRSFRTNNLSDLIRFGETFFYLEAEFQKEGISQTIKVYYDENNRKIQYNQTVYPTLTSLLGIFPSVLLSPDDLSLISGSPAERRRFLDLHIAQTDPVYVHHLGRYFKAMKQRNHLLRSKSEASIYSWEQMMTQSANYLIPRRLNAVSALQTPAKRWMQILSRHQEAIGIQYQSSLSLPQQENERIEHFQALWKKTRLKEMHAGTTLIGPHRDDLLIHLSEKPAKVFSSEGQKRSCISSLRFAQWEHMAQILGHAPVLGIDDFGIQLDPKRQTQLKTQLLQFKQVFLTSPFSLTNEFLRDAFVFKVEKGTLQT